MLQNPYQEPRTPSAQRPHDLDLDTIQVRFWYGTERLARITVSTGGLTERLHTQPRRHFEHTLRLSFLGKWRRVCYSQRPASVGCEAAGGVHTTPDVHVFLSSSDWQRNSLSKYTVSMHTHAHKYIHTHIQICTQAHLYISMYMHTHTNIYT